MTFQQPFYGLALWNHTGPLLAPYAVDLTTEQVGSLFVDEQLDTGNSMQRATWDIQHFDSEYRHFVANHMITITWWRIPWKEDVTKRFSFQLSLVSDGTQTFIVIVYETPAPEPALYTEYRDGEGCINQIWSSSSWNKLLHHYTNNGHQGRFIFPLVPKNCLQTRK